MKLTASLKLCAAVGSRMHQGMPSLRAHSHRSISQNLKSESDPSKKRPIGAGTAPRRSVESFIAAFYQSDMSEVLQPRNFCVGSNNTCPMLEFMTNEEFFKCFHCTVEEMKDNPLAHVGILADAANMFNTTIQEECARTLAQNMPVLQLYIISTRICMGETFEFGFLTKMESHASSHRRMDIFRVGRPLVHSWR